MQPDPPDAGERRPALPAGLPSTLAVLAFVVGFAALGLAFDHNWLKLARVLLAAAAYAGVLVAAFRALAPRGRAPWWPFALAGAVAGGMSGMVRPGSDGRVLVTSVTAAALLLGTVHWIALRWSRRVAPEAIS